MTDSTQPMGPENCSNIAHVREGVDAIDRDLVALIARRFAYIDAAARIKTDRNCVRDELRKSQVLSNVELEAIAAGLDPVRVTSVWEVLVEQSIAYELLQWDHARNV